MIAGKDPVVGQALDLFVPDFRFDPDELLPAAHAGAARLRAVRRRRQTTAVVAFAALLLFAGAAIAAQKLDLLPFLHSNDRNGARFSINPHRTYRGAASSALTCRRAKNGRSFICQVSGPMAPGNRQYELGMRTDRVPLLTRKRMLAALDRAQAQGADPAQVARVRADLAKVGDDFIRALAILIRIETVGAPSNVSGGSERVPPRGVPAWTACRELTLTTFRCRPLDRLVGVASGTPLYDLQPSRDWRRTLVPPQQPLDFERLLARLLGRKPNANETRFFIDFATVAVTSSNSSGPHTSHGTVIAVSNPRSTARLAPRSLGVRTRVVSAVARPLPPRLPGGVTRSSRLYRVVFKLLRGDGVDPAGRYTVFVYVSRSTKLGVWRVVWVAAKP